MDGEAPHANKKVILLAAAAICLTLFFLFVTILLMNPSKNTVSTNNQTQNQITPGSSGNAKSMQSAGRTAPNGWQIYKNDQFSIGYPQDWGVAQVDLNGGDKGISITPLNVSSTRPAFVILMQDVSVTPTLKQKQKMYTTLGFAQSTTTVAGQRASVLRGTIPPTNATSSAAVEVLQVRHVLFDKDGKSYLLKSTYVNAKPFQPLEDVFAKMIASLRLN